MSRARVLAAHLRRYPWWYGVAAVWLVGMLALPIVQGSALADALAGGQPTTNGTVGPGGAAPEVTAGGPVGPGTVPEGGTDVGATGGDLIVDTTVPDDDDAPSPLDIVPPEILDAIFDALPPIAAPPLPAELVPLLNAIAPIAASGCSGIGLAGVVIAVAAQSVDGVPFDRILPYLAPVSTACASFPIPKVHTVCEADEPLILDLAGLTTSPPILGLGIDQLRAFEQVAASSFGVTLPAVADSLSQQRLCRLVS